MISLFVPRNRFYKSHTKRGCFRSAIANYLVLEGDSETARNVFEQYPSHEFVGTENATMQATIPRILRDLTGRAYDGVLYTDCSDFEQEVTRNARERFNGRAEGLVNAAMEDMSAGNIKPLAEYSRSGDNALYVIAYNVLGIPVYQWVTAVPSQNYFIDDGTVRRPLHNLEVFGVLSIRKNGKH